MRRAAWLFLLWGCTWARQVVPPAPVASTPPSREMTRPSAGGDGQAGYFPLPPALARDPAQVTIPALDFEVLKPQRVKLANGVTVYLAPDPTVPLLSLRALVKAGSMDESPDKIGLADLTFDLLPSGGAGNLSADDLDELLEFHAADVGSGASEEYSSLDLSLRSEDMTKLLPVFVDMLLRPRFQKDRLEISVAQRLEQVRRRPDSPDGLAGRALRKAVFGPSSPFAREPTERTLKAITAGDLKAFHKKLVTPRGTLLMASGSFDQASLLALLNEQLGGWKGSELAVERVYPRPEPLRRRVILIPKDIAQAKIRIGGHGYPRLSPREYAMRVLNSALGTFGFGRLYKQIRVEKGLAYSAHSQILPGPTTGMFYASLDTKPDAAVVSLAEALKILEEVTGPRPLSQQEISLASDTFLNSFAFRFDSPAKVVREKAVFDFFGYPDDYLDRFRENISKVDAAATQEAARLVARGEELQIIVVGPPEKLGDLSRFGPVTTITDVEAFR